MALGCYVWVCGKWVGTFSKSFFARTHTICFAFPHNVMTFQYIITSSPRQLHRLPALHNLSLQLQLFPALDNLSLQLQSFPALLRQRTQTNPLIRRHNKPHLLHHPPRQSGPETLARAARTLAHHLLPLAGKSPFRRRSLGVARGEVRDRGVHFVLFFPTLPSLSVFADAAYVGGRVAGGLLC